MVRSFGEFNEPIKNIEGTIGTGVTVNSGVPYPVFDPLNDVAPAVYLDGFV